MAWQLEHHSEWFYTYTLNTNAYNLNGSGTWLVTSKMLGLERL